MPYHLPANREWELDLFDRMVGGQTDERILLLEAEGGLGKTTLLNEFVRRCPSHVRCARIDLKGGNIGLDDIFFRLCDALDWPNFPTFVGRVDEYVERVTIQRNVILGWQNRIEVALGATEFRSRVIHHARMTQAFFTDLRTLDHRVLLVFDTFNEASLRVQEWLKGYFLAFAQNTPELVVIIAGRRVPEISIEWSDCCLRYQLGMLEDVDAWHEYVRRHGWKVPREWIEGFCFAVEGHPAHVDSLLNRAARR